MSRLRLIRGCYCHRYVGSPTYPLRAEGDACALPGGLRSRAGETYAQGHAGVWECAGADRRIATSASAQSPTSAAPFKSFNTRHGSKPHSEEFSMNAVKLLKADHEEVAAMFEKFDGADEEEKAGLAEQVCQMLTVHAQIEEELLYPAARETLQEDEEDLVDEAAVEHASIKELVDQIEAASPSDALFEAKVKVLGEYVTHH